MVLAWVIWLLILVPLSVDHFFNIPVGDYDLRPQYFALLALGLWSLWRLRGEPAYRRVFLSRLKDPALLAFGCMMAVGVLGWWGSPHPSRSMMFLLWTAGTISGLALWIPDLQQMVRFWIPRTLAVYGLVQSAAILLDSAICPLSDGKLSIAKVMVYGQPGYDLFCRPHAFYQEPGYFCAFALLLWVYLRDRIRFEPDSFWKKTYFSVLVASPLAMLVSTSRMGLLGVAALVVLELAWFLNGRVKTQGINKKLALKISAVVVVVVGLLALGYGKLFYEHFIRFLAEPWSDHSFRYRFVRVDAAWQVFLRNPWVGAGPGAAGAYLVDHLQWHHVWNVLAHQPERLLFQRHDPLSLNLYTELLSEWGSLGTAFFFLGLGLLVRGWGRWNGYRFWITLLIIYTATQTLARFDLWLLLTLIALAAREKRQGAGSGSS